MTRLEQELSHMLRMLAPPFTENWRHCIWAKAQEMAKDREFADLPRLLTEHMRGRDDGQADSQAGEPLCTSACH